MAIVRTIVLSILVLLMILLILAVSVLPAIIALKQNHRHKWAILALTMLGGWTIIGWIGALIWALKPNSANGDASLDDADTARGMADGQGSPAVLHGRRGLSGRLIAGIILLPFVFSWFTLRRGYSNTTRGMSIGYAMFCILATAMCIHSLDQIVYGLKAQGEKGRANAQYAVANKLYLATTPEELTEGLDDGRDVEFERRILLIEGSITSMRPRSGHTDIVVQGAQGVEITMNGDYLVGLKPGHQVTAVCGMIMHIGPVIRFLRCMVAPRGQMPMPVGADIQYGIGPSKAAAAPAEASTPVSKAVETVPKKPDRAGSTRSKPDEVIQFGRPEGGPGGHAVDNPFTT